MVRGGSGVCYVDVYSSEGAGTGSWEERGHPVIPGAAVHRRILYRINAIND